MWDLPAIVKNGPSLEVAERGSERIKSNEAGGAPRVKTPGKYSKKNTTCCQLYALGSHPYCPLKLLLRGQCGIRSKIHPGPNSVTTLMTKTFTQPQQTLL